MARNVLVVDDIPYVRKTIIAILAKAHYNVVGEASNGKEALDLYLKLRPDVVTMDVVMPQMSGIEATQKIIKEDITARIIIVTALDHENLIIEAIAAGAKDYLVKPFSPQDLVRTVDNVMTSDLRLTAKLVRKA